MPAFGAGSVTAALTAQRFRCALLSSAYRLSAWAGVASGNNESAGKQRPAATHKGKRRAAVAVAHTRLVMAYHILTRYEPYHDLGANSFDERDRQAVERRLVHRLEALCYTDSLQPPGSVA